MYSYPQYGYGNAGYAYPVYVPAVETRDQFIRRYVLELAKLDGEAPLNGLISAARTLWNESTKTEVTK